LVYYRGKAFIVVVFLLGVVLAVAWMLRCPKEVTVSIGEFPSMNAGLRAAVRRLPVEIDRCPAALGYRMMWISPDSENERVDRQALLYFRGPRWLGYERDVFSGISGRKYVVDEAAIRAVAEKGGTLEDFAEYDQLSK
jgi:hypothetical protein